MKFNNAFCFACWHGVAYNLFNITVRNIVLNLFLRARLRLKDLSIIGSSEVDKKADVETVALFTFAVGISAVQGMNRMGSPIGVGRVSFIRLGVCSVP